MRKLWCAFILLLIFVAGLSRPAYPVVLADSVMDFSAVQGHGNWFYGFVNRGLPTDAFVYDASTDFEQFGIFDTLAQRWEATDAQVGANNNQFLNLNQQGGHPAGIGPSGQDSIIWATRRYVSDVDGLVDIAFDLRKRNVSETRGGGITGRIFIDGIEVFSLFIDNFDDTGVQGVLRHNVAVGTLIDFAIDPTGVSPGTDSDFSARADGSNFSAIISEATATVPEPITVTTGVIGLAMLGAAMRRRTY